jgi:hypothetical protein
MFGVIQGRQLRMRVVGFDTTRMSLPLQISFIFVKLKVYVVIITSVTRPGNSFRHIGHRILIRYVETVRPSVIPGSKLGSARKFVGVKRPK